MQQDNASGFGGQNTFGGLQRGTFCCSSRWRAVTAVPGSQLTKAGSRGSPVASAPPDRQAASCYQRIMAPLPLVALLPSAPTIAAPQEIEMRGSCSEKIASPDFIPLPHKGLRSAFSFFSEQVALIQREKSSCQLSVAGCRLSVDERGALALVSWWLKE